MPLDHWGATAVWDGKEVLFIGGSIRAPGTGIRLAVRSLAYNPRTNRWRWLPRMAYPRSGFAAVWTGRQVLVWGGLTAGEHPPATRRGLHPGHRQMDRPARRAATRPGQPHRRVDRPPDDHLGRVPPRHLAPDDLHQRGSLHAKPVRQARCAEP